MDTTPDTKWSLPEPTVSEDGTFCDSLNDTISRLDHENSPTNRRDMKKDAVSEYRSEQTVEKPADLPAGNAESESVPESRDQAIARSLLHDDLSDVRTALETPQVSQQLQDTPKNDANLRFAYNNHNESVFDDFRYFPSLKPEQASVVKFDPKDPEQISHATLKALLVQLTSPEVIDYSLICDFFLTYRTFTESHTVLNLLLTRLIWSLQYINSGKPDTEKLGKLVLLRTFVVLRHWILNYFYDDFESDERLCDVFAFHMNSITAESGLISPEMAFELKIFCDLKTHWLTQIHEFFGRSFLPDAAVPGAVYATPLPMACEYFERKLTKSNTEQSIHTNPSFRRSAMLSLYDQKIHHKCIIYDGNNTESPELPISKLVHQHKSSRASLDDKIRDFHARGRRENVKTPVSTSAPAHKHREPLAPKHNHMNLQDSSVGLKKVAAGRGGEKTGVSGEVKSGFSTNGCIRLPSARVAAVVPLSPVKKMGCSLKEELRMPAYEAEDVGRKKSIKRIVEGWTKSLYSPDMRSDRSVFSQGSPSQKSSKSEKSSGSSLTSSPLLPDPETLYTGTQPSRPVGERVDVLSARIIDELEFVIRYYIFDAHHTISETPDPEVSRATIAFSPKKSLAEILLPSPTKKQTLNFSGALRREKSGQNTNSASDARNTRDSTGTTRDMSIHDISELNIEKIDNLFSQTTIGDAADAYALGDSFVSQNERSQMLDRRHSRASKQSSFGGRVTSINWNDHGNLFLENSASLCDTSAPADSRVYGAGDDRPDPEGYMQDTNNKSADVVGVPNDGDNLEEDLDSRELARYGAEVSDLGIAMSPQSQSHAHAAGEFGSAFPPLTKSLDSFHRHESLKSYMSYDSAFSALSESSRNERYSAHLKKKTGCYDLRKLAEDGTVAQAWPRLSTSSNVSGTLSRAVSASHAGGRMHRASMTSHLSKCSSAAKRTRLSTLCALTELPFSSARDSAASASTRAVLHDESAKGSDLSVSSIFSIAAKDTKDAKDVGNIREEETDADADVNSDANRTSSVAIPGINTHVLRELAAIPDESFCSKNPIQLALYKLEGKQSIKREYTMDSLQTPALSEIDRSRFSSRMSGISGMTATGGVATDAGNVQRMSAGVETRVGKGEFSQGLGLGLGAEPAAEMVKETENGSTEKGEKEAPHTPQRRKSSAADASTDAFPNTDDILNEINNAVTEDAISYSSDIEHELRTRPITPIKAKSRSTLLLSQPNNVATASATVLNSSISPSESTSPYSLLNPKLVLDGYSLASESLSVKEVMAAGSHVSFIVSYDSRTLAEHFTIIERDMLQEIDWKELIELKWNKDLTPVNSWLEIIVNDEYYNKNKGVNLAIARFNLMVNWIISEILLTGGEDERREIISRFIHIAYHSYEMQNFSTLMQMVLALTSEKVHNLKSTWKHLSPGDILTLKHLEQVTSPLKNFINMRVSANQIRPSKGCIPFVGLYLSDLIFNAERPKFVKTKKEPMKTTTVVTNEDTCEVSVTQGDSTMASTALGEAEKMINFSRFRTSVHIVKSLSQSIEWSQNYNVDVNDELLSKCLYIKSLDEGEMNYCVEQLGA